MKIQKIRRSILHFSSCFITFGVARAADPGAPMSEQYPVSNVYHNVTVSDPYETDGRVNPAHSRKMIARLQAATSSARPIYLSINAHAGHGIGSALSIRVNQQADVHAFCSTSLPQANAAR
jgi:protease II